MINYTNLNALKNLRMFQTSGRMNIKCSKAASCPHGHDCDREPSQCPIYNDMSELGQEGKENPMFSDLKIKGLDNLLGEDYFSANDDYDASNDDYDSSPRDYAKRLGENNPLKDKSLPYNFDGSSVLQEPTHYSSTDYINDMVGNNPLTDRSLPYQFTRSLSQDSTDYNTTTNYNGENN